MKVIGIIPARYGSTRFEGKALADIFGKPMIQHVYERAKKSKNLDQIFVATDDQRIYETVIDFGGEAVLTAQAETGTDRVATVAAEIECDVIANIQGDEPLLESAMIDQLIQPFFEDAEVSTLKGKIDNEVDYFDPNVVKVVTDRKGNAMYFSRSPLPGNLSKRLIGSNANFRHIGLYAYRKDRLLQFVNWDRTPCEVSESLEQLRFLENGVKIRVVETEHASIGVDTPEDLARVCEILRSRML